MICSGATVSRNSRRPSWAHNATTPSSCGQSSSVSPIAPMTSWCSGSGRGRSGRAGQEVDAATPEHRQSTASTPRPAADGPLPQATPLKARPQLQRNNYAGCGTALVGATAAAARERREGGRSEIGLARRDERAVGDLHVPVGGSHGHDDLVVAHLLGDDVGGLTVVVAQAGVVAGWAAGRGGREVFAGRDLTVARADFVPRPTVVSGPPTRGDVTVVAAAVEAIASVEVAVATGALVPVEEPHPTMARPAARANTGPRMTPSSRARTRVTPDSLA